MLKILILEDNKEIIEVLSLTLSLDYELTVTESISQAKQTLVENSFDLHLLDWMLPDGEGISLCEPIKEKDPNTKIIMVTALNQPEQIVAGLESGADDYITKPFDIKILKARIKAHLRHHKKQEEVSFATLKIDTTERLCHIEKELVKLTKNEFLILQELIINIDKVCSRNQLVQTTSGDNIFVTERTIDTHITSVRKKIGKYSSNIKTVRGIGYRFTSELNN